MRISMLVYALMPRVVVRGRMHHCQDPALRRYVLLALLSVSGSGDSHAVKDKTRTTLTMDDLSAALGEYGINARKPEFYM